MVTAVEVAVVLQRVMVMALLLPPPAAAPLHLLLLQEIQQHRAMVMVRLLRVRPVL
jgi:hypothetical protein